MSNETIENGMFITLGVAAKQTGISKATLSRAIRDGKLSANRSAETNSFKIDQAELHRYTESVKVVRNTVAKEHEQQSVTSYNDSKKHDETDFETRLKELRERDALEIRAKLAEERLADLKGQLELMKDQQAELKAQRDGWQQQAERALLMQQSPARRGLFGWLGRKAG
jgi:excisionase family DNA binding protein